MRKKIIGLAAIIALMFVAGCAEEQLIGGDKDEHGCLIAAGYSWCESKQECIRTWEEGCPSEEEFECEVDDDCIPLPSDCHPMLCINKAYESNYEKPEFCTEIFMYEAAYNPEDCLCVDNVCVNKNLGRSAEDEGISLEEAITIAEDSECTEKGFLTEDSFYNENTKTWWIDLEMKEELKLDYCNPACVVNMETMTAEVIWRCTGPETNDLKQKYVDATIYGIELEIERFPDKIELKDDLEKYKNINLQDYELHEKKLIIYETSSLFPIKFNSVLTESRSGPFYYVVGIKGDNYSVIETETKYNISFYLVYQRDDGYNSYYVYLDEWTLINDEKQDCMDAGGEWKTFPNTCVDSCEYRRNEDLMCGMALTDGCDCGEGMCWNGESCEPI